MAQKFFRSPAGAFYGAYDGPASPGQAGFPYPADAVAVAVAPVDGRQTWTGAAWSDPAALPAPKPDDAVLLIDALAAEGVVTAAKATALKSRLATLKAP